MTKSKKYPVVAQAWVESERGWGVRPDGYSLHLTEADRKSFEKAYIAKNHTAASAPDCYSRMDGSATVIDVVQEIYDELAASKNGIFVHKLP